MHYGRVSFIFFYFFPIFVDTIFYTNQPFLTLCYCSSSSSLLFPPAIACTTITTTTNTIITTTTTAHVHVEIAASLLADELFDLASGTSSYNRAYGTLVRVQQLTEIEEILQHKKRVRKHGNAHHPVVREQRKRMHQLWRDRLTVCHQKVEVYVPLLLARSLMPPTTKDLTTWLRFARLCQSSNQQMDHGCNRLPLSLRTMTALGARTEDVREFCGAPPSSSPSFLSRAAALASSGSSNGSNGRSRRQSNLLTSRRGKRDGASSLTSEQFQSFGSMDVGHQHHHDEASHRAFRFLSDVGRVRLRGRTKRTNTRFDIETTHPRVALAYLEHLWADDQRVIALERLRSLLECVTSPVRDSCDTVRGAFQYACDGTLLCDLYLRQGEWLQKCQQAAAEEESAGGRRRTFSSAAGAASRGGGGGREAHSARSPPSAHAGGGLRQQSQSMSSSTRTLEAVLESFEAATRMDPTRYVAWHAWALVNFRAVDDTGGSTTLSSAGGVDDVLRTRELERLKKKKRSEERRRRRAKSDKSKGEEESKGGESKGENELEGMDDNTLRMMTQRIETLESRRDRCLGSAVRGFFRSIALGQREDVHRDVSNKGTMLQDVLRLLTLWFTWGHRTIVQEELRRGFPSVDLSTWQLVVPQLVRAMIL